jgi:hypothetical protein
MNASNSKIFGEAAVAKMMKANAVGTKTTWTTEDHLRCVAECCEQADIPPDRKPADVFYEIISDCYNVSAFAKWLEGKYGKTGHYIRSEKRGQTVSELDAACDAAMAAMAAKRE